MNINKEFALLISIKNVQFQCHLINDVLKYYLGFYLISYNILLFDKDILIDVVFAVAAVKNFIKINPERREVTSLKRLIKLTK
jgi:hypothetical protein